MKKYFRIFVVFLSIAIIISSLPLSLLATDTESNQQLSEKNKSYDYDDTDLLNTVVYPTEETISDFTGSGEDIDASGNSTRAVGDHLISQVGCFEGGFFETFADTYISNDAPTTTFGHSDVAYASSNQIAFFKTEFPDIPEGSIIVAAYLNVAYSYNNPETPIQIGAYRVGINWYESSLTWDQADEYVRLGLAAIAISKTTISDPTGISLTTPKYARIDITTAAQYWLENENSNYGIGLRRYTGASTPVEFKTSEASQEYRPFFEFIYQPPNPYEDGNYYIKNIGTEKFIDVEGPSKSDGAIIQQWSFHTGNQEKWTLAFGDDGYYTIKSLYSGKYIGLDSSDTTVVRQYTDISDYTKWSMTLTTSGNYVLKCKVNESSGYVLATPSATSGSGANLTMTLYTDDTNYRDEWECHKNISFKNLTVFLNYSAYPSIQPEWANEYLSTSDYTYSIVAGADKISIDSTTGRIVGNAIGSAKVQATPTGSGASFMFSVKVVECPPFFYNLYDLGYIEEPDMLITDDGFFMITKPLSDILIEAGITDLYDEDSTIMPVSSFYDDWYLYSITSSVTRYGLLKMREEENDGGDNDNPGVTVSFVGLDTSLILSCINNQSYANKVQLYRELDYVTYQPTATHETILSEYFSKSSSVAPYYIAKEYAHLIAQTANNGKVYLPDNYIEANNERLINALNDLNQDSNNTLYSTAGRYISIADINNLTLLETKAILTTHTANTSLYSFAAEIVFHADATSNWMSYFPSFYASAIRADMIIDNENYADHILYYYDQDGLESLYVRYQKDHHTEEEYIN